MKPSPALLAAILLPLIGLVGTAGWAAWQTRIGTEWRVPIQGYDPRDLLRGHFITFRYVWPMPDERRLAADWRICFSGPPEAPTIRLLGPEVVKGAGCTAIAQAMPGHDALTLDASGIGRGTFYLDERYAGRIGDMLVRGGHEVSLVLVVTASGRLTPRDLLVDGKPFREVPGILGQR
jgi:hypothetical protein